MMGLEVRQSTSHPPNSDCEKRGWHPWAGCGLNRSVTALVNEARAWDAAGVVRTLPNWATCKRCKREFETKRMSWTGMTMEPDGVTVKQDLFVCAECIAERPIEYPDTVPTDPNFSESELLTTRAWKRRER